MEVHSARENDGLRSRTSPHMPVAPPDTSYATSSASSSKLRGRSGTLVYAYTTSTNILLVPLLAGALPCCYFGSHLHTLMHSLAGTHSSVKGGDESARGVKGYWGDKG